MDGIEIERFKRLQQLYLATELENKRKKGKKGKSVKVEVTVEKENKRKCTIRIGNILLESELSFHECPLTIDAFRNVKLKVKGETMLENVEVGQSIWTIQNGWDRVKGSVLEDDYSIITEKGELYCLDGKLKKDDVHPSAFICNPFDINDKPPIEFKEGEIIMVSDMVTKWKPAVFNKACGERFKVKTFSGCIESWPFARKLTDKEKGL